jgi:hypothetical protein
MMSMHDREFKRFGEALFTMIADLVRKGSAPAFSRRLMTFPGGVEVTMMLCNNQELADIMDAAATATITDSGKTPDAGTKAGGAE